MEQKRFFKMQQPDASPKLTLSTTPRKKNGVVAQHVLEEMVLYDGETEMGYSLNPSARSIWELCDGQRTLEGICKAIGGELNVSADFLHEDVKIAVSQLVSLGLINVGSQSDAVEEEASA